MKVIPVHRNVSVSCNRLLPCGYTCFASTPKFSAEFLILSICLGSFEFSFEPFVTFDCFPH